MSSTKEINDEVLKKVSGGVSVESFEKSTQSLESAKELVSLMVPVYTFLQSLGDFIDNALNTYVVTTRLFFIDEALNELNNISKFPTKDEIIAYLNNAYSYLQ